MTLFQQITKQKEKKERKNKSNFQVKFIIWSCFIQTLVSSYQKTVCFLNQTGESPLKKTCIYIWERNKDSETGKWIKQAQWVPGDG
jgi:hypothetical protein